MRAHRNCKLYGARMKCAPYEVYILLEVSTMSNPKPYGVNELREMFRS